MNRIITDHTKWVKAAAVIACCLALAILSLAASAVHAQGPSYNPYLIQGIVDQTTTGTGSTLLPVEFGGTGYVRFDVGNTGFDDLTLAQDDEMTLVVTLSKGVPDAANPLDALSGPGVAWFSWQYDPAIKTYYANSDCDDSGRQSCEHHHCLQGDAEQFSWRESDCLQRFQCQPAASGLYQSPAHRR